MMDTNIGRFGIEESFEKELRGFPGIKNLEVNARGREIREISKEESVSGSNVKLTIDINLQKYINSLLKDKSGAVVVLDANNGEILALESSPNFDLNLFTKSISQEEWNKLINNPMSPLVNKSISGEYSPGSTFKLIVLYSALINKIIRPNGVINCSSNIEYGDRKFYCWCHKKKTGCWATQSHTRNVGPELAIAQSCDGFFYELAKRIGIENIVETARNFGLGSKSGLNLKGEKDGLVPNKSWKKKITALAAPEFISSEQLDLMLEQYYLKTDTPTLEYVYSLCALGASSPSELQPILESTTLEQLIDRCMKCFKYNVNMEHFQPQDS